MRSAAWARSPRRWPRRRARQGVEIVLDTPVDEIIVEQGRAAGAVAGGKAYRAKAVVAGVHPKLLFTRLLPEGAVEAEPARRMAHWASESATFRMNVALSELPRFTSLPEPGDHLTAGIIIAPSLDYMDRAYLTARTEGFSREPIVEMLIPSTLDDSLAPAGRMSPACSASISLMTCRAAGMRAARRRPTRSSPMSTATRRASRLR